MNRIARPSLLSEPEREDYDAVIIGGNLAGLFVAYTFACMGFRVLLLERSPFLGGGDQSFKNENGRQFDAGLHLLDADRSPLTTKLFTDLVGGRVRRGKKKRQIVLRGEIVDYDAPVDAWPDSLRELLPSSPLVDKVADRPLTRDNLAESFGRPFVDLIFDDVLASYPSDARHARFDIDESRLVGALYPWFFPRAERSGRTSTAADAAESSKISRTFHDAMRASGGEAYLYPEDGGFGAFANAFHSRLIELGTEVLAGVDDLALEIAPGSHSASVVRARGRLVTAERYYWCAPIGILRGILDLPTPELKPDQFLLGSFEFADEVRADATEILVGDPAHRINRLSFPGRISFGENNLVQVEFCYPKADAEFSIEPEGSWRDGWLDSLRRLGIVADGNELRAFDFRTFQIIFNHFGVEGKPFDRIRFDDFHPSANIVPVLPSVANVNINTRIPQYLSFVADEVAAWGTWEERAHFADSALSAAGEFVGEPSSTLSSTRRKKVE